MTRRVAQALVVGVAVAGCVAGASAQDPPGLSQARAACDAAGDALPALARRLTVAGVQAREVLPTMANVADQPTRSCGLRGLAALRDSQLVAATRAAWTRWPDEAYLVARWAAHAAGGPDARTSAAFVPLVDELARPALAAAAGEDGLRLLGEIEAPAARDALLTVLARDDAPALVDAAIRALARHGEARALARVTALGQTVLNGLGGNAMFEEARRIHAAAFYLLALGAETRDAGLLMLTRLSPADQADAGAWAVQTLCERAVRRPADAPSLTAAREGLVDALTGRGIRSDGVAAGTFTCPPAP